LLAVLPPVLQGPVPQQPVQPLVRQAPQGGLVPPPVLPAPVPGSPTT
jgi:hypothetical protein